MIKDRIRYERLRHHLTVKCLSDMSGVSAHVIRHIERQKGYPNSEPLYRLAVALSIPMDLFFKPLNNHEINYIETYKTGNYDMKQYKTVVNNTLL